MLRAKIGKITLITSKQIISLSVLLFITLTQCVQNRRHPPPQHPLTGVSSQRLRSVFGSLSERVRKGFGARSIYTSFRRHIYVPFRFQEFSAVIPQIYPIFADKSHLFIYSYDRYNSQLYCFCPTRTARIHRAACIEKHQQPCIGAARPGTGQSRHSESE